MKQTISEWFSENDCWFQHPVEALSHGFTLAQLASEYERVFITREMAAYHMANDVREHLLRVGGF